MRKVTFGGANSLDNYFARTDNAVDWLMWSDEAAAVTMDFWNSIDTVLLGRKTYEVALKNSKGESESFPGIKSYIFSRTLKEVADKRVEIISEKRGRVSSRFEKSRGKRHLSDGRRRSGKDVF